MKIELGVKRQRYDRDEDITIENVNFPIMSINCPKALDLMKILGKKGSARIEYEVEGASIDEEFGDNVRLKIVSIEPESKRPFMDSRNAEEAFEDYMSQ